MVVRAIWPDRFRAGVTSVRVLFFCARAMKKYTAESMTPHAPSLSSASLIFYMLGIRSASAQHPLSIRSASAQHRAH